MCPPSCLADDADERGDDGLPCHLPSVVLEDEVHDRGPRREERRGQRTGGVGSVAPVYIIVQINFR
jgi:hypothetical protein